MLAIIGYFTQCDLGKEVTVIRKGQPILINKPRPKTIEGICLALGFRSRQSFYDYLDRNKHSSDAVRSQFAYALEQARLACGQDAIEGGMMGDYEPKITGLNLQTNHGYRTKSEVDTRSLMITITDSALDKRLERTLKRLNDPVIEAEFD